MDSDFLLKDTEINQMLMKEINNGAEKKKRVKKKDKKEKSEKVGVSCLVETEETKGERKSLESDIDAWGDDAGKSGRKARTAKKVRFQLPGEEKEVEKCLVKEDEAAATLDCVSISGMLSRNEEVLEAEKVTSSFGDGDKCTLNKVNGESDVTQECDLISGKVSRKEEVVEGGRETSSFGETDLGDGDKDALGKGDGKAVACPAVGNCGDGIEEEEMDLDEEMVIGGGVNLEKYVHEETDKVSAIVKARSSAKKRKRSRKVGVKDFMSSSESEDDLNSSTEALGEQTGEVQTLHSFRGTGGSVHPSPNVKMGEVRTRREQQSNTGTVYSSKNKVQSLSSEWSESENCGEENDGDSNHSSSEGEGSVPAERLLVPGLLSVVLQKMRSCASARLTAEEGSFLGEGTSQVI